ncbi:MAG TPA: purine-nucleoside phosphorylase [Deinococcales bacterium]|nr:purine-nucleoside phosphorylase [Deinococcales bacterium]
MPIHLKANMGDVAPLVLLPGDPGRAQRIADTYLDGARLYTSHRALLGFTGTYKGVPVSVQTTSMGCPSAAIVTEELHMLGAKTLLRIGTCGGTHPSVRPGELIVARASVPLDGTTRQYLGSEPSVPLATPRVTAASMAAAAAVGIPAREGLIASEDGFYASTPEHAAVLAARGVLGIEMEASAVFTVATLRGMEAGCLVTVSNHIGDPALVADEILAKGVDDMIQVGLETLVRLHQA